MFAEGRVRRERETDRDIYKHRDRDPFVLVLSVFQISLTFAER